jgi:hypothetical protein
MRTKDILLATVSAIMLASCAARSASPTPNGTAAAATPTVPSPTATRTPTSVPIVFPKIDRHPKPWEGLFGKITELPTYDPDSDEQWQMDLRSYDVSALDFRNSLNDLLYASFDDKTVWPPKERMPAGFDREKIMETGKNPGLGIRTLQDEGITGKNIGIAIIDLTLLVDHQEYSKQLRLYEETEDIRGGWRMTQMHGPAVASIAVGKTVGVAPEADLYYIANVFCSGTGSGGLDFGCLAKSVRRIMEINRQLPPDRKIRVLSMSIGWEPESKGYAEIQAAVQEAKDAGIFIICSSESEIYGFNFHALGRFPLADPDAFDSYEPGLWWAKRFYQGQMELNDTLLVPMDSRTTASPTGNAEYVFYREGGWSWAIPYIAGVYALAAQVRPNVTPDLFWSTALHTGRTIQLDHGGKTYSFGTILDPVALIRALQEM